MTSSTEEGYARACDAYYENDRLQRIIARFKTLIIICDHPYSYERTINANLQIKRKANFHKQTVTLEVLNGILKKVIRIESEKVKSICDYSQRSGKHS